jgi:hypothetical protein
MDNRQLLCGGGGGGGVALSIAFRLPGPLGALAAFDAEGSWCHNAAVLCFFVQRLQL